MNRWIDDLMPLLGDDDPFGVDRLGTRHLSLDEALLAYATFPKKEDGAVKIVFTP